MTKADRDREAHFRAAARQMVPGPATDGLFHAIERCRPWADVAHVAEALYVWIERYHPDRLGTRRRHRASREAMREAAHGVVAWVRERMAEARPPDTPDVALIAFHAIRRQLIDDTLEGMVAPARRSHLTGQVVRGYLSERTARRYRAEFGPHALGVAMGKLRRELYLGELMRRGYTKDAARQRWHRTAGSERAIDAPPPRRRRGSDEPRS